MTHMISGLYGKGGRMPEYILEMRHITKAFMGVKALNDVNLFVKRGEIHALVGENGAGKSTLMNILSGVYPCDSFTGEIILDGEECMFRHIKQSERKGIVIIHQELALIPYLAIAENMFLGNEQSGPMKGVIDWNKTVSQAAHHMKVVGLNENPNTLIQDIGVGKQQLVEIAKALVKDVKLLILDEPTAALNDKESEELLSLLVELKKKGTTAIIISHKINEVVKVADTITVIRDGETVETIPKDENISEDRIISGMVGRKISDRFPNRNNDIGQVIFEVKDWNVYDQNVETRKAISNVSFSAKKGEVVGFAGLMGAGRTELMMSLFGRSWGRKITGHVYKNGTEIQIADIPSAIGHGIAYVTEDRKNYGLILINDVKTNATLVNLHNIMGSGIIDNNREIEEAESLRTKLNIKCQSINSIVASLSGGNQQKVVLAKWISSEPDVLILDEPTRGIDVGAKFEIYNMINALAAEGKCVIMVSSEMPELLGMCDRIYVVNEGELVGEFSKHEASQENIMRCIMHHNKEEQDERAEEY